MEHGVQSGGWREVQFVGNLADAAEHLEGTVVAFGQFVVGAAGQALLAVGLQAEQYPGVYLKGNFLTLFVSLHFHPLLSSGQVGFEGLEDD